MKNAQFNEEDDFFLPEDYKPISFEVTEGPHLARLYRMERTRLQDGRIEWKPTWEILDMESNKFTYLAISAYKTPRQHEIFQSLMASWLGADAASYRKPNGAIDFDRLIAKGHLAMVTIEFYNDGNHEGYFRSIKAVNPVRQHRRLDDDREEKAA